MTEEKNEYTVNYKDEDETFHYIIIDAEKDCFKELSKVANAKTIAKLSQRELNIMLDASMKDMKKRIEKMDAIKN